MSWQHVSLAPDNDCLVLCTGYPVDVKRYGTSRWYVVAEYRDGFFYDEDDGALLAEPTHWMPIPEGPNDYRRI